LLLLFRIQRKELRHLFGAEKSSSDLLQIVKAAYQLHIDPKLTVEREGKYRQVARMRCVETKIADRVECGLAVGAIGKLNLFRVYVEVEAEDRPQSAARQGKRFSKPILAEALSAHLLIRRETLREASDDVRRGF
jgi:hypothetical protein